MAARMTPATITMEIRLGNMERASFLIVLLEVKRSLQFALDLKLNP
jgi:hypothetical protein